jgi:hypothetical protein
MSQWAVPIACQIPLKSECPSQVVGSAGSAANNLAVSTRPGTAIKSMRETNLETCTCYPPLWQHLLAAMMLSAYSLDRVIVQRIHDPDP